MKYNISCQLERRNKNGKPIITDVPILLIITFDGHRLKLPTGYVIDAKKWDAEAGRVKKKFSNSRKQTSTEINSKLSQYETAIDNLFKSFELKKEIPTVEDVKAEHKKSRGSRVKAKGFFDIYDRFLQERSKANEWSPLTLQKFKTIKKSLIKFNPKLTFSTANKPETLSDFVESQKRKGLRNTTIAKNLRFVKSYLKWAYDKGISSTDGYKRYSPNFKGTDGRNKTIIYLTPDEFKHLLNYDSGKGHLNRVRDVFCFCCATGLRYSDVYNLTKNNIKNGCIEFTTQKTGHTLQVQLNDYSSAILEKYKDIPFDGNKVLPVISNQKMNDYLKELCKLAKIDEPVTISYQKNNETITETRPKHELIGTHCGRRTFVCLCLYKGIAPTTIMKWTGHTSYETLKPYVGIMDALKKKEMEKFTF